MGIPLNAPHRNYKDENHKPELLCALTSFQALKGFRKIDDILFLMDKVACSSLSNELADLRKDPDEYGLRRFFTALMQMDKNRQDLVVGEAICLSAGELHTYLHGVGIELMANSDNVIRGGLTAKHVDVPALALKYGIEGAATIYKASVPL